MNVRMKRVLWLTLLMTVGAAQSARAGIWDVIWEMSGPQMHGIGVQCDLQVSPSTKFICDLPLRRTSAFDWRRHRGERRIWFAIEPLFFFASGKEDEFRFARAKMFALDPVLTFKWELLGKTVHTGVGASLNHFFGTEVQHMNKAALKVRQLLFQNQHLEIVYNLRLYPDGFEVLDRPTGGKLVSMHKSEAVHAIAFTFGY